MSILETVATSGPGRLITKQLGLKDPPKLRRGSVMPAGPVVIAPVGESTLARETLSGIPIDIGELLLDVPEVRTDDEKGRPQPPRYERAPGAIVVDASRATRLDELESLRAALRPIMRQLERSGRAIFLGPRPEDARDHESRALAEALDGVMRTVSKELRGGSTANLVRVAPDVIADDLHSTFQFLLSGRAAFISGQTWEITHTAVLPETSERPLEGKIVVVTGAARGIGRAIAETVAEAGATVVCVDMPSAGEALTDVAVELRGSALQLDITSSNAAEAITSHISHTHGRDARLYAIVHNAGITRDKMLANLDEKRWAQVVEVNLKAEMAINRDLLASTAPGSFADEARIIGVASTSGIAGNRGQANYAASKAGVIGYTQSLAAELADSNITANAVAPGFIETEMTAQIPYVNREIFRRVNSLSQGGRPVDVAQTIAYLCHPGSRGVNGQVIRVCGHNMVGK